MIFHANGVGGPAMEHLIEAGALGGVIDYTLSELANSLLDGIHATGPDRLRVAGRRGIPQVVVPGCVDFFNQGPRDELPERYRGRKTYFHNPVATLVRLTSDEGAELGRMVAERLNEARGPGPRGRAHGAASRSPTPRAATSGTRRRTPPSWTRCANRFVPTSPSSRSTPTWTTPTSPNSSQTAT